MPFLRVRNTVATHLPRELIKIGVGATDDPEARVRLVLVLPALVIDLHLERCSRRPGGGRWKKNIVTT